MLRTCRLCGLDKSADDFYASQASYCKPCWCAYCAAQVRAKRAVESPEQRETRLAARRLRRTGRAERKLVRRPVVDGRRVCAHCAETKPVEDFHRNQTKSAGITTICKACSLVKHRAYYQEHREHLIAYEQARRATDLVAARAYEREVYRRRIAKARASSTARLRAMPPLDAPSLAFDGILRHDPCCYCGGPASQVDHIEPVGAGGANAWANLTAACRHCNRAKSDKSLLTYLATNPRVFSTVH